MTTLERPAKSASRRSSATLESTVFRALSEASSGQLPPPAVSKHPVSKQAPRQLRQPTKSAAKTARVLREQLGASGLLRVETVRVRPRGGDRQLRVEYAVDPENRNAVLMRVSLTSEVPLAAPPTMLTTQQAADALNVSRPYITRLVDNGKVRGVERTQSGHRRIPAAEIDRIHAEMRSTRRKALETIDAQTQNLRQRELVTATTKSKRRWVAKQT